MLSSSCRTLSTSRRSHDGTSSCWWLHVWWHKLLLAGLQLRQQSCDCGRTDGLDVHGGRRVARADLLGMRCLLGLLWPAGPARPLAGAPWPAHPIDSFLGQRSRRCRLSRRSRAAGWLLHVLRLLLARLPPLRRSCVLRLPRLLLLAAGSGLHLLSSGCWCQPLCWAQRTRLPCGAGSGKWAGLRCFGSFQ